MNNKISVLMSVYKNDKAQYIIEAVESIINQTLKPKQIVIVIDGPVSSDITNTLNTLKDKYNIIELYPLERNVGLGKAMQYGTEKCLYEFIARMDSDDIAKPERFEKQINCFKDNDELCIVGTNSYEFFETINNPASFKIVPQNHNDIIEFMKSRCPFCHPSIMIKKESLLKAGGYLDWHYAEDWYLAIRLYLTGAKFYNLQENLMSIRLSNDTYARRGGLKMYKSIKNLLKFMKKNKIINNLQYTKECIKRFIGHVLTPKKLKRKLYLKFMRKHIAQTEYK